MPHDLFGNVAAPSRPARAGRSSVLVVSVSAHAIAIAAIVVVQLLGVDGLPVPHETLAFTEVEPVRPQDIDLPAHPRAGGRTAPSARSVSPAAAPLGPPRAIAPETGLEDAPIAGHSEPTLAVEAGAAGLSRGTGLPAQEPPPPPPDVPVRLHAGIRPPQRIGFVAPAYPEIARAAHVEGVVVIEATIAVDGHVQAARVLRSIPLLDGAALDAVRQWRFSPALLSGVPVPVIMTVTVIFSLSR